MKLKKCTVRISLNQDTFAWDAKLTYEALLSDKPNIIIYQVDINYENYESSWYFWAHLFLFLFIICSLWCISYNLNYLCNFASRVNVSWFKDICTFALKHKTEILRNITSVAVWSEDTVTVIYIVNNSPYCDAVSRCDETKTIKPIINEAFVASSGDIITDYNDLYCLFTHCIVPRKHYHVCICDWRNAKQARLYTAQNSHLSRQ